MKRCIIQVGLGHGHIHHHMKRFNHCLWLCRMARTTGIFPGWTGYFPREKSGEFERRIRLAHFRFNWFCALDEQNLVQLLSFPIVFWLNTHCVSCTFPTTLSSTYHLNNLCPTSKMATEIFGFLLWALLKSKVSWQNQNSDSLHHRQGVLAILGLLLRCQSTASVAFIYNNSL